MKMRVLTFLGMALALTSGAAQADEYETAVDGFCTMQVLNLERAKSVKTTSSKFIEMPKEAKDFYKKSLKVAKTRYAAQADVPESTIEVYEASVQFEKGSQNSDEQMLGVKITLHMNGDEDRITYYFYRESSDNLPKLKMYLHDSQSATSYWTCE